MPIRTNMLLGLLALAWVAAATGALAQAPIRFTHVVNQGDLTLPVATELFLRPVSNDLIDVKVAGDLGPLQAELPAILSRVIEDSCRRRIGLEIREVRAEGDAVRLDGRIQFLRYRCRDPEDFGTRRQLFHNTTEIDALLGGQVADDCLHLRLDELSLEPGGVAGGILNATGMTGRISERAREALNDSLQNRVRCIDLPDALDRIDTRLRGGGLRDFGDGRMGFVVTGTIDVRASNVVDLVRLLARNGGLRQ
jgi:hypothetical protein